MAPPKKPRVSVTKEKETGRNTGFVDNKTGEQMTRAGFAKKINQGEYPDYYTRKQGGLDTPVAKPDGDIRANQTVRWLRLDRSRPWSLPSQNSQVLRLMPVDINSCQLAAVNVFLTW